MPFWDETSYRAHYSETALLVAFLKGFTNAPTVFVSISTVQIYGNSSVFFENMRRFSLVLSRFTELLNVFENLKRHDERFCFIS